MKKPRMNFKNTLQRARRVLASLRIIVNLLAFLFIKYLLIYTYILIFAMGGVLLFVNSFLSKSVDTTTFTSIGFGFFAVIANICFSWSRTFSSEQAELASKIGFQGERLLLAALAFLVASLFKYLYVQTVHMFSGVHSGVVSVFLWFLYVVFFCSFIYAYLMAAGGIYELFALLLSRHVKRPSMEVLREGQMS